jgi:hypothetical protein
MSERVSVHVSLHKIDVARFCEVYGEEPEMTRDIGPNEWVEMDFGPISGAGEEERRTAAAKGIMFFGYHWACDDHPAAVFCSTGDGELYSWLGMKVYDGTIRPVSVWTLDKDKLESYAEPHNDVIDAFQEVYKAAWEEPKEEDFSFEGMLEARLDCLDNKTIIEEMGLYDPEVVSQLLDYLRTALGNMEDERNRRRMESDPRGWLGHMRTEDLRKVHDAATKFLHNMKPMTTNPAHTQSAAHVAAVIESIAPIKRRP